MSETKQHKYSIWNQQTQTRRFPEFGECKPEDVDLVEHEEIHIWDGSDWVWPDPEPTPFEKSMKNIKAFLGEIHDEIERVEGMQ